VLLVVALVVTLVARPRTLPSNADDRPDVSPLTGANPAHPAVESLTETVAAA
jgi:hypothetical protein